MGIDVPFYARQCLLYLLESITFYSVLLMGVAILFVLRKYLFFFWPGIYFVKVSFPPYSFKCPLTDRVSTLGSDNNKNS